MTVHRFFVAPESVRGDRFAVPESIEHQVRRVLRLRDGASLVLLTGDGGEVVCRLAGRDCVVEERRAARGEPGHRLTIIQALLKSDGLESVVRHGTEVGIAAFTFVITERTVARDLAPKRLERLRAIAREAAEQSERGLVPDVAGPIRLREAVRPGAVLLAERTEGPRLSDLAPPAAIVVGPEGGFTPDELATAEADGLAFATLGRRILRSETVGVAAAAVVLSLTGDFA